MNVTQLQKKLQKMMTQIAKDRDALRDLISEAESLDSSVESAIDALETAADHLSELV